MGFAIFKKPPNSADIRTFLGRVVKRHGAPKYIISDKGGQFDCGGYRTWCRHQGIDPRYASTGSQRATAVIERFFLSLKNEWLRRIRVPLDRDELRLEISSYISWFEHSRPHQGLDGRTPQEVYEGRPVVKRASPNPRELPPSELIVNFHDGRRQLPIVELRRAA